jgi:hypothetical protein
VRFKHAWGKRRGNSSRGGEMSLGKERNEQKGGDIEKEIQPYYVRKKNHESWCL